MIIHHYNFLDLIVSNRSLLFILKFRLLLCYFFGIKRQLCTAFYLQTDNQIKWHNSIIKAYLQVFINFEQNNWARLIPIAEFAYNNAQNTSTSYMPFELSYVYHPRVFFKEDTNFCS